MIWTVSGIIFFQKFWTNTRGIFSLLNASKKEILPKFASIKDKFILDSFRTIGSRFFLFCSNELLNFWSQQTPLRQYKSASYILFYWLRPWFITRKGEDFWFHLIATLSGSHAMNQIFFRIYSWTTIMFFESTVGQV